MVSSVSITMSMSVSLQWFYLLLSITLQVGYYSCFVDEESENRVVKQFALNYTASKWLL